MSVMVAYSGFLVAAFVFAVAAMFVLRAVKLI